MLTSRLNSNILLAMTMLNSLPFYHTILDRWNCLWQHGEAITPLGAREILTGKDGTMIFSSGTKGEYKFAFFHDENLEEFKRALHTELNN